MREPARFRCQPGLAGRWAAGDRPPTFPATTRKLRRHRCSGPGLGADDYLGRTAEPHVTAVHLNRERVREPDQRARARRPGDGRVHQVGDAEEVGDERVGGLLVQILRRCGLFDPAPVDHRDPVAHRERFFLVVGHVDEGDADLRLQLLQLDLELAPQLGVECAERLVEQQHCRLQYQRAGQGDPLLLAAGKLARLAAPVVRELHEFERLADPALDLIPAHPGAAEPERHVVKDPKVRKEGVALEDRVDRALARRRPGDVVAVEEDPARRWCLEPRDHSQRRGLPAARGSEQGEEPARRDLEVNRVDSHDGSELLGERDEAELAGAWPLRQARYRTLAPWPARMYRIDCRASHVPTA